MTSRRYAFAIIAFELVMGWTTGVLAQINPPPPPQPSRQAAAPMIPADRKAYLEAIRITDPQKKIEALEKYLTDFPVSFGISQANQQLLSTLVKRYPEQTDRILAQARRTIASTQEQLKGSVYTTVIATLIDGGVLLDKAEDLTREGLVWVEEDQAKRRRQARAPYLASLGRLNLRRGKTKEAEKYLREASEANPQLIEAMLGLAEVAEKNNDTPGALNYYASASLTGRMRPESRERFYDLYRKTHEGSLKGIEELIDVRYRRDFPNPVKVEPYTATPLRSGRTVLAEVFTGAGCGPCVAADLAFDAYLERYARKEVIVIMYHLHIPLPDPMTNPSTEARSKYYMVNGVPSYAIDGAKSSGGGSREMTKDFYGRTTPTLEKRLTVAPEARIALNATSDAGVVKVKVVVDGVKSGSEARIQIALVEEMLRYSGENGVRFHPMVVRSLAGPGANGFAVDANKPTSIEATFDVVKVTQELKAKLDEFEAKRKDDKFAFAEKKHEIDPSALSVVAFVQDEETRDVLQATSIKLKPAMASVEK